MTAIEKVNEILIRIGQTDSVDINMSLKDDLAIDSLRLVELISEIEDTFEILLEMNDLDPANLNTVSDIYKLIQKYVYGT